MDVLNFNPNPAAGAGCIIQKKAVALKLQWVGDHFAFVGTGPDRCEAICTKGKSSEWGHEDRHFFRASGHDIQGGIIGAVAPAVGVEPRPDESFAKGSVERAWPAGGHEEHIGALAAIGEESSGSCNINVGGPKIGVGQGGVDVLAGKVWPERDWL